MSFTDTTQENARFRTCYFIDTGHLTEVRNLVERVQALPWWDHLWTRRSVITPLFIRRLVRFTPSRVAQRGCIVGERDPDGARKRPVQVTPRF